MHSKCCNARRKVVLQAKLAPQAERAAAIEGEDAEAVKLKCPKATSRRYPVKIMYMGVVGRPRPEHNFDGKILLLRVSEPRQLKQATSNERFVDDAMLEWNAERRILAATVTMTA